MRESERENEKSESARKGEREREREKERESTELGGAHGGVVRGVREHDAPATRVRSNRLSSSPCFVQQVAVLQRTSVEIKVLKRAI